MSDPSQEQREAAQASEVKQVGRGTLVITFAKFWFTLCGMGLLVILPRIGGETEEERAALFGTYMVVVGILNPLTMMMITGTIQAVSKFVSENPARYGIVIRRALLLQVLLGTAVAGAFALSAPIIAGLLDDESLTRPLQIASVIIFLYALYAAFVGGFNGTKRFTHQALMDISFATLKVVLILGLVYFGFGVNGAIGGFAFTALVMTTISGLLTLYFLRSHSGSATDVGMRQILGFEFWIMIYALAFNYLMNMDLYIVKALAESDAGVGVYSAGLQVARLPYVAVISVTFVLFPLLSNATYAEDLTRARDYIFTATRYALLIIGSLSFTLAACSEDVLRLVFTELYLEGTLQLTFLALAYMFFSLLAIFATIIISAGKPQVSTLLVTVTLAVSAGLTWFGMSEFGRDGAAVGVMCAMLIGMLAAGGYIKSWLKPSFPVSTLVKMVTAGLIVAGVSFLWHPQSKILIVFKGAGAFLLFMVVLTVLREFTAEDKSRFAKVIGKG